MALVERIAASPHFHRSKRLQSFLRYVCERAVGQKPEEISEQLIGHRVFGRETGYNPADDNIVRVEARELRRRLEAYFTQEGAQEELVIEIPRGSYVPVFCGRGIARPETVESSAAAPPAARRDWLTWSLAGLSAVLALLCAWLWNNAPRGGAGDGRPEIMTRFWSTVLTPDRPTVVAAADSNFALLQDLRRETATFDDYVSGSYFSSLRSRKDSEMDRALGVIAGRSHTSLADALLFARIDGLAPPGVSVTLRFAREIRAQDLKSSNVVFIGSERANPWAGLFDPWRNFHFEYDRESNRARIVNRSPREGEPAAYLAGPLGRGAAEAYGAIAFLPNLDRSGRVVILAGTSMQGSEAAGDYLTNPERLAVLAEKLAVGKGPWPYFEAIVKLVAVDVSSISTEIVAQRLIDASKLEPIRYTQP